MVTYTTSFSNGQGGISELEMPTVLTCSPRYCFHILLEESKFTKYSYQKRKNPIPGHNQTTLGTQLSWRNFFFTPIVRASPLRYLHYLVFTPLLNLTSSNLKKKKTRGNSYTAPTAGLIYRLAHPRDTPKKKALQLASLQTRRQPHRKTRQPA